MAATRLPATPKAKKRIAPKARRVQPAITNPVFTQAHAIAARGAPTNPDGKPGNWFQHGKPPIRGGGNSGKSTY